MEVLSRINKSEGSKCNVPAQTVRIKMINYLVILQIKVVSFTKWIVFTLTCRLIGRGYSAATKVTSLLILDGPVSKKSREKCTFSLTTFTQQQATERTNKASLKTKEYPYRNGQIEVLPGTDLSEEIPQIDVSVDGSQSSRGWLSHQEIVEMCFE